MLSAMLVVVVMQKYTEKRNADGYTVILSVSNPSPSNIYGVGLYTYMHSQQQY